MTTKLDREKVVGYLLTINSSGTNKKLEEMLDEIMTRQRKDIFGLFGPKT